MIAEEYFPNLQIRLYPSLLKVNEEQMEKLNADIIIMDELHRTGAEKWGTKINTLIEKNPNAKILGLTATPDRMDDINVVDKLFGGKVVYELTLIEALRRGIVKSPVYVKCDYALGEYLEGIQSAIEECDDEQTKQELQEKYDKMRKIVENAEGIPELLEKNITKKNGKFIVFCKDKEQMDELMEKAKEWFANIDSEPEIYSVYSGEGYSANKNKKIILNFEKSKSDHIKLLFSIEMLNEGLHVEDISGVIMARPTDSKIIYLQQLGRALSSDTSREQTIVFDLVNNYIRNNLDREINQRTRDDEGSSVANNEPDDRKSSVNRETAVDDIGIFRIQGETLEFLELLEDVDKITGKSTFLKNARAIREWIEKSGDTKPPAGKAKNEEEKRLGQALSNIRRLIKTFSELKTDEEKEKFRRKYPEIDEVLDIVLEIDIKRGNKKQKELAMLIRHNIEKRKVLKEAKKLEQEYEEQLKICEGEKETNEKIGVDFNEE